MPDIVASIKYVVEGDPNQHKLFKSSIKDIETIIDGLNRISNAKVGVRLTKDLENPVKVTRELKQQAKAALETIINLMGKAQASTKEFSSAFKGLSLVLGTKKSGEQGVISGKAIPRTADFSKTSQLDLGRKVKESINKTFLDTIIGMNNAFSQIPKTAESTKIQNEMRKALNNARRRAMEVLREEIDAGTLTQRRASYLKSYVRGVVGLEKPKASSFISQFKAGQTGTSDVNLKITESFRLVDLEINKLTSAFGALSPKISGARAKFANDTATLLNSLTTKLGTGKISQADIDKAFSELKIFTKEMHNALSAGGAEMRKAKAAAGKLPVGTTETENIKRSMGVFSHTINRQLNDAARSFGSIPSAMTTARIKFTTGQAAILNKLRSDIAGGTDVKTASRNAFAKLRKLWGDVQNDIKKARQEAQKAQNATLKAARESARMATKQAEEIQKLKNQELRSTYSIITKNIQRLENEKLKPGNLFGRNKMIDREIAKLHAMLAAVTRQITLATPGNVEAAKDLMNKIRTALHVDISKQKAQISQQPSMVMSKMLFNRATLQSFAGFAGQLFVDISKNMEKVIDTTRIKGSVVNAVTGAVNAAMMASWYIVTQELTNIMGNVIEIILETLFEVGRFVMVTVAGILKGVGIALMKGFATSVILAVWAAATGAVGVATGGIGGIVGIILGGVAAITTILSELAKFFTNIFSKIIEIVSSAIKVVVSLVSMALKGLYNIISTVFTAIFDSLKKGFKGFVDFLREGFKLGGQIIKESLNEYVESSHLASMALNETLIVSGQTLRQFEALIGKSRATYGFDLKQTGEAIFDVVSSGYMKLADANNVIAYSAKLAIAGESDLKTATNALITSFQNYEKQGETLNSITDTLVAATTLGRVTMGEMGNSLKFVIGLSSRASASFRDTMMGLSFLTRVFGRGSIDEATRYLSRFFEAILMPKKEARGEFERLGVSFKGIGQQGRTLQDILTLSERLSKIDFEKVRKIFPTIQSRRAWLALTKDIDQFKSMMLDSKGVIDSVGKQFELMYNTPRRVIQRLTQSFKVFYNEIGGTIWKTVLPDVLRFTQAMSSLANYLYSDKGSTFIENFVKWLQPISDAILKPMVDWISTFIDELEKADWENFFNTGMMKTLQAFILHMIDNVKAVIAKIVEIVSSFMRVYDVAIKVELAIRRIIEYLMATNWKDWFAGIVNYLYQIYQVLEEIFVNGTDLLWFQSMMDGMLSIVVDTITTITKIVSTIFEPFLDRFMAIIGIRIRNGLMSIIGSAMTRVGEMLVKMTGEGLLARMFSPWLLLGKALKIQGAQTGGASDSARNIGGLVSPNGEIEWLPKINQDITDSLGFPKNSKNAITDMKNTYNETLGKKPEDIEDWQRKSNIVFTKMLEMQEQANRATVDFGKALGDVSTIVKEFGKRTLETAKAVGKALDERRASKKHLLEPSDITDALTNKPNVPEKGFMERNKKIAYHYKRLRNLGYDTDFNVASDKMTLRDTSPINKIGEKQAVKEFNAIKKLIPAGETGDTVSIKARLEGEYIARSAARRMSDKELEAEKKKYESYKVNSKGERYVTTSRSDYYGQRVGWRHHMDADNINSPFVKHGYVEGRRKISVEEDIRGSEAIKEIERRKREREKQKVRDDEMAKTAEKDRPALLKKWAEEDAKVRLEENLAQQNELQGKMDKDKATGRGVTKADKDRMEALKNEERNINKDLTKAKAENKAEEDAKKAAENQKLANENIIKQTELMNKQIAIAGVQTKLLLNIERFTGMSAGKAYGVDDTGFVITSKTVEQVI